MKLSKEEFENLPRGFQKTIKHLYKEAKHKSTLEELFNKEDLKLDLGIWELLRGVREYSLVLFDERHGPVRFECCYNPSEDNEYTITCQYEDEGIQLMYNELGQPIIFVSEQKVIGPSCVLWPSKDKLDWSGWTRPFLVGDKVVIKDLTNKPPLYWHKFVRYEYIGKEAIISEDNGEGWFTLKGIRNLTWHRSWIEHV